MFAKQVERYRERYRTSGAEDRVEQLCRAVAKRVPSEIITRGKDDLYLGRHYLLRKKWLRPSGLYSLSPELADFVHARPELAAKLAQLPGTYLHHFYRSDLADEVHCHPWEWSLSIILTGGYIEHRVYPMPNAHGRVHTKQRLLLPGMVNIIRWNDFHRVELLNEQRGCWTLFFTSEKVADWGFLEMATGEFMLLEEHRRRGREKYGPGYGDRITVTRTGEIGSRPEP